MIRTRRILVVLLAVLAGAACEPPAPPVAVPDLSPEERAAVLREGAAAADALIATLGARVGSALREEGPAGAVAVCSALAGHLTDSVARARGVEIRRTSWRRRSPENEPDAWDERALQHFEALRDAGEGAPWEALVIATSAGEARYYRPLVAEGVCLRCHGPRESLDGGLLRALHEAYPEDRATGYALGDLRGVVRVTVPRGNAAVR